MMSIVQEVGSRQPSVDEVSRTLDGILAGPDFATIQEPISSRIYGWILGKILEFLSWLFPDISLGAGQANMIFWIVTILLGLACGALLFQLLRRYVVRPRHSKPEGFAPSVTGGAVPRTISEWEALARAMATEGQWREAALALYQAVVLRLAEAEVIRLHRSKTPGDYRIEARRKDAGLASTFQEFVRTFEPIAFGTHATTAAAYGELRNAAQRLGSDG